MKKFIIALFFLPFFIYSCTNNNKVAKNDVETIDFADKNGFELDSNKVECKYITLETTDSCLIGDICDIKIFDNKIYIVADYKKVFVFDINGKFLSKIGNQGQGPGEYIMPYRIYVNKKENILSIADIRFDNMLYYDYHTYKFITQKKTCNISDCILLPDNNIAWYTSSGFDDGKRNNYYVKITDSEMKELALEYKAAFVSDYGVSLGSAGKRFYQTGCKTFVYNNLIPEVYEITSKNATLVKHISFGSQSLPSIEWLNAKSANGTKNYFGQIYKSNYICGYNLIESANYIITSYVSASNFYIGFYNKKIKKSCKYNVIEFGKRTGLPSLTYDIYGIYDDFFVSMMSMPNLKNSKELRADLKRIVDSASEEDNPIICLFKIIE